MRGQIRVCVNVGGTEFFTTASTLEKAGGFLESLLQWETRGREMEEREMKAEGTKGDVYLFVDRDAASFPSVLTFLRTGHLPSGLSKHDLLSVAEEADFYSIPSLVSAAQDEANLSPLPPPPWETVRILADMRNEVRKLRMAICDASAGR